MAKLIFGILVAFAITGCGTGITSSVSNQIAEDIVGAESPAARRGRLPSLYSEEDAQCVLRGNQPVWVSLGTRDSLREREDERENPDGFRSLWQESVEATDTESESRVPDAGLLHRGDAESARLGAATRRIKDNGGYFGVRVRYLKLENNVGPTGRRYFPAVKTDITFATEAANQELSLITQPSSLITSGNDWNRISVLNRPLLAPSPYYGGDINLDMALIGVNSGDVASSALATLDEISQLTGVSIVSRITSIAAIGKSGIEKVFGIDDEPIVRAGVTTSWDAPNLGFWVLAWPQEEFTTGLVRQLLGELGAQGAKYEKQLLSYFQLKGVNLCNLEVVRRGADDFRLFLKVDRAEFVDDLQADGSKLTELAGELNGYGSEYLYWDLTGLSWALMEVEGFKQNPNWWQVPNLIESYKAMMASIVQGDLDDAERKLTALQEIILGSPDLTFGDRLLMAGVAKTRANAYCTELAQLRFKNIEATKCAEKLGAGPSEGEEANASSPTDEAPASESDAEGETTEPAGSQQANLPIGGNEIAVRPVGLVFRNQEPGPASPKRSVAFSGLRRSPTEAEVIAALEAHAVADFARDYLARNAPEPISAAEFARHVRNWKRR